MDDQDRKALADLLGRGHGYAYRCEVCDGAPAWRLDRTGDAVVSWACADHLSTACERLQRDHEITELTIRRA